MKGGSVIKRNYKEKGLKPRRALSQERKMTPGAERFPSTELHEKESGKVKGKGGEHWINSQRFFSR